MATQFDAATQSPFRFRQEEEAEKDRASKERIAMIGSISKAMGGGGAQSGAGAGVGSSPFAASSSSPFSAPSSGGAGGGAADSSPQSGFSAFIRQDDPATQQLRQSTIGGIQSQFDNPAGPAFDQAADRSRDDLAKTIQSAREGQRDDLIRTYGPNASQVLPAMSQFDTRAQLESRGLNRDLSIAQGQAGQQGLANAIAQAMGFLGQEQQGRQFDRSLEAQLREGAAGRASQERIAFADLGVREKALAQEGAQFQDRLEFEKYALQKGYSEAEIARTWQSMENAKARQSQEKIAFAGLDLDRTKFEASNALAKKGLTLQEQQLQMQRDGMNMEEARYYAGLSQAKELAERGLDIEQMQVELQKQGMAAEDARFYAGMAQQERLQQADIASREKVATLQIGSTERLAAAEERLARWQTEVNRTLQLDLQENQVKAQAALQKADQTFQSLMQDKGFVQTKELEAIKQQFAKDLQAQGFSQEQALQAADQKFRGLEAQRDRDFNAQQAEYQRKWVTGERLDTQDHQMAVMANEQQFEMIQHELNRSLQLEVEENRFGYQQALQKADNAFKLAFQENGFDHEKAVQASNETFQKEMQAAGFTQEQALQATRLTHDADQARANRDQQLQLFFAQQAQEDRQFMQELGLQQDELNIRANQLSEQMRLAADELGLRQDQWETAKNDAEFQKSLELATIGLTMSDGNITAMQPFAAKLANTLGNALGMDASALEQAITESFQGSGAGGGSNNAEPYSIGDIGTSQGSVDQFIADRGSNQIDIAGHNFQLETAFKGSDRGWGKPGVAGQNLGLSYDLGTGRKLNALYHPDTGKFSITDANYSMPKDVQMSFEELLRRYS